MLIKRLKVEKNESPLSDQLAFPNQHCYDRLGKGNIFKRLKDDHIILEDKRKRLF